MNKELVKAINKQINNELYSAYLYLDFANWAAENDFNGISNWLNHQAHEEYSHAAKMMGLLRDSNETIVLDQIDKPNVKVNNPLELFENVLAHEKEVSKACNHLADMALDLKEHAAYDLYKWFVIEQLEEEASVGAVLAKFKANTPIFMIDAELAQRS